MSEQTGPIILKQPARDIKTCSGCIYHKHTLVKSGQNPIYKEHCLHSIAPSERILNELNFAGNLKTDNGLVIPGYWCPYLNKAQ